MARSTGDADTMIIQCALQYAIDGSKVNVVADDTDVLVLLIAMYHWKQNMKSIYFLSEAGKNLKIWRISDHDLRSWASRSYCNIIFYMLGVAVIQHPQHSNRVKLA